MILCLRDQVLVRQMTKTITNMTKARSPGYDDQSIEHFGYACEYLPRILAIPFNSISGHNYLPEALMRTIGSAYC